MGDIVIVEWPDDDEQFAQLVSTAVSDRRSRSAVEMRDALAELGIVDRTVEALDAIIEKIDVQLVTLTDVEHRIRVEKARKRFLDNLSWFEQMRAIREAADG